MEIEIDDNKGKRTIHSFLTVTNIARKLEVSSSEVTRSIMEKQIPIFTAVCLTNGQSERRVAPEHVLTVIDDLVTRHRYMFPDLEPRLPVALGVMVEVNPAERPRNQAALRRGRNFSRRLLIFHK